MKHKKSKILPIILIIASALTLIIVLLVNLGIIILPKSGYIFYFNLNKNSFEEIVEYVEKSDDHLYVDDSNLESAISTISDQNVYSDINLLIKSPYLKDISGNKKTYMVDDKETELTRVYFTINNLFNCNNTPVSIIYSPSQIYDEGFFEDRDYWLSYEQIDENWYLEIWHDN